MKRIAVLITLGYLISICHAERYALVVGIDSYQSPTIAGLQGACADAAALSSKLTEGLKFPKNQVSLLLSSDAAKPTKSVILAKLASLADLARPGDTVIVSFAGHGIQISGGEAALVPFDADLRDSKSSENTTISAAEVRTVLSKVNADLIVCIYDMCRNDPIGPERGGSFNSMNPRSVASAAALGNGDSGPKNVVTLFACSPSQVSYEWTEKKRGFFSFFLEQGLSGAAADAAGKVTTLSIMNYLSLAVQGAVRREVGRDQTPMFEIAGPDVWGMAWASGLEPGTSGLTAIPRAAPSSAEGQFDVLFQRGYEAAMQGKIVAAEEYFEDALKLKPKSTGAMVAAGKALQLGGDTAGAQKWFAKAIKEDPDCSEAWLYAMVIAGTYRQMGLPPFTWKDQAEQNSLWDRALELNRRNPLAWFLAGATNWVQRERAVKRLNELTAPGNPLRGIGPLELQDIPKPPQGYLVADLLAHYSEYDGSESNKEDADLRDRVLALARSQKENAAIWWAIFAAHRTWNPDLAACKEAQQSLERLNISVDQLGVLSPKAPLNPLVAKLELQKIAGGFIASTGDRTGPYENWGDLWGRVGWNNEADSPAGRLIPVGNGNFIDKAKPTQLWCAFGPTLLISSNGGMAIRYL